MVPARDSRSLDVPDDAELRLPRAPGVIRRFWSRHPLFSDILIALATLVVSIGPAAPLSVGRRTDAGVMIGIIAVLTVLGCVALVFRRRRPVAVAVLATAASMSLLLLPMNVFGPLLMIALYAVPVYASTRRAWIVYGGVVVALGLAATAGVLVGTTTVGAASNVAVSGTVSGLIGVLIGINVGNRKRYVEAIIERSRQLAIERDQQGRLAAAAERTRIAREMHDVVSHSLTVIVALAEGATATPDHERSRAATAHVSATARSALAEMRAMLGVLREEDAPGDAPLLPVDEDTIPAAVAAARRAGLPVELTMSGAPIDDRHVRLAAARMVQEGLTNVLRHAPGARAVRVDVRRSDTAVSVQIVNDGADAATPTTGGGFGLRGLRERAARVGGTIEAGPGPGATWRLHAELPVSAADATPEEAP